MLNAGYQYVGGLSYHPGRSIPAQAAKYLAYLLDTWIQDAQ